MSEPFPMRSRLPVRLDPRQYAGATGLVRFAVGTGWRMSGWALRTTISGSAGVIRDVAAGEPITEILDRQLEAARRRVVRALGVAPSGYPLVVRMDGDGASAVELREQGNALLRRVGDPQPRAREEHPAFARILRELIPDEARVMRFLALAGSQPVIDVRTKPPLGKGSELLATGINLVADMAGCSYPERNQQYLTNLVRLGLVLFSEEPVDDPRRYSFVEAQPAAAEAMAKARRTATVYRSVGITEFGRQFCEVCFTLDDYDAGGWLDDIR